MRHQAINMIGKKTIYSNLRYPSFWHPSLWFLGCILALTTLLVACDLPHVSAEDRLFLNVSLDFLGDYQLPKQEFQKTPVGGLSGITYDRKRDRLYAISDDRSDLAPARFYTLKLGLDGTNPRTPKISQVTVEGVTFIQAENGNSYPKGTVDPEGIVLSPLDTLFISSEGVAREGIPPFIQEFERTNGAVKRKLLVPTYYIPDTKERQDGKQTRGVRDNLGFEALTLSPAGSGSGSGEPFRLFAASESALAQDNEFGDTEQGATKNRVLHYLIEENRALLVSEYLYPMDPPPDKARFHGLTEILAIDQGGHFLSLERSFGDNGFSIKLFQLSTGTATDISAIASLKGNLKGIQPIRKELLLDLKDLGIRLDNLEGMTFGPRLPDGSQSLILVSDNNFSPQQVTQFLLFRIKGKGLI